MVDETDESLMLAYRDGDAGAFERLFARHRDALYRYVIRQAGDPGIAEELFQDIWMNLIRSRDRYEARARFTTLLYRIANHRVIDHYRTRSTRRAVMVDASTDDVEAFGDGAPTPERMLDARRRVDRLQALVAALPAEQRDAFLLREEAGLDLDQIAMVTDVGRETVKSRLRYAIARLRAGLEEAS